jgi:hypothetical protein
VIRLLANLVEWQMNIDDAMRRMRFSACHARGGAMWRVGAIPRRRGHAGGRLQWRDRARSRSLLKGIVCGFLRFFRIRLEEVLIHLRGGEYYKLSSGNVRSPVKPLH